MTVVNLLDHLHVILSTPFLVGVAFRVLPAISALLVGYHLGSGLGFGFGVRVWVGS